MESGGGQAAARHRIRGAEKMSEKVAEAAGDTAPTVGRIRQRRNAAKRCAHT